MGFCSGPLRFWLLQRATLANAAPPPELVEEMIERAPDRVAAILAAWRGGGMVHRQVAIRQIARPVAPERSLSGDLETIALTGALDVDVNVRQAALGLLRDRQHPAAAALAAAQLSDPDPQVRLLGLNALKPMAAGIAVPTLIPLLDDPDPWIVTMALKLLERWADQPFGIKLSEATPVEDPETGLTEFRAGSEAKARAAAAQAKAWWVAHQNEFPPVRLELPAGVLSARLPVPAGDFRLRTIEGQDLRLSDFRGQVVLLNFWTTWCPACVSEMPELIALQARHAGTLAIIGVSLDLVPDGHGHIGGHPAVEEPTQADEDHDHHDGAAAARQRVREKVIRTVKARGLNYPVLLDEHNEVGGRFNGGELPTTVIIDAEGYVRRRFVGARRLAVFEAMIA